MLVEEALRHIAEARPSITLAAALVWADAACKPSALPPEDLHNPLVLAMWASEQPSVMALIEKIKNGDPQVGGIHVIKEIRALTLCNLPPAKDAYYVLRSLVGLK